jgi:trehalose-6-phosphate synthase
MRLTVRLVVSLAAGVLFLALLFSYLQVRGQMQGMRGDLVKRAAAVAGGLDEVLDSYVDRHAQRETQRAVDRVVTRERLAGVVVFDDKEQVLAASSALPAPLMRKAESVAQRGLKAGDFSEFFDSGNTYELVYRHTIAHETSTLGTLAIFYDAGYIEKQRNALWEGTFLRLLGLVSAIALITLMIIRWSIIGPIARTADWLRQLRAGKAPKVPPEDASLLKPLAQEVTHLVQSLETARAVAEEEARLRDKAESIWTAERLRAHVRSKIQQSPLFVVSNREPYVHVHQGREIASVVPASGLVTALEPILRATNGVWIAQGSGDADRDVVDEHDRLRVPPDQPEYTLRRVWLTKEEEEGYYYGFSNEGLWPLCHIAHTRPSFRTSDWSAYQEANQKFAHAVLQEMAGSSHAVVLAQDYHFALLPRLVKDVRPDARVAIFWHIPWPNPEAFGICPWQKELLDGLLGADLVGFHVQAHCNNFLETVDRALESQIDWERFTVRRAGHVTRVRPFPISVAVHDPPPDEASRPSSYELRANLLENLGVEANFMGIGVDRADYTKGLLERFRGLEIFFDKFPAYQGKFTFVQIASPSRMHIKRYHDLLAEVESEAARINWKFQTNNWRPIALLTRHHSHEEIEPYYRAADV